jgi:hypothetical protein
MSQHSPPRSAGPFGGIRRWARREAAAYRSGSDQPPLGGYLALLSGYLGGTAALAAVGRLAGRRLPERVSGYDLALLGVATHRLSRTLAKDPITSPLRAPFTEFAGTSAAGELAEQVRGDGLRHSAGELLACPICLAQWVASALAAGLVFVPRQTRLVMAVLSAVASADFLQYVYALLQQAAE